tara:strand:+ start:17201 stop:17851 length:651 start_codon:yes stop_codon:yes gene_type:complete
MGDPGKTRKKYSTPRHPWQRDRLEREKVLKKEFGLKNKKEIWKANSELKRYTSQAKRLIGLKNEQSEKEKRDLLARLQRFNLVTGETKVEEVLNLTVNDILVRRLQTMVVKKDLARSMEQARQFIVHGHIVVNNRKVTVPSYMVSRDEEFKIVFDSVSSLSKEDHPERFNPEEAKKKEEVVESQGEKIVGKKGVEEKVPEVKKEEKAAEKPVEVAA